MTLKNFICYIFALVDVSHIPIIAPFVNQLLTIVETVSIWLYYKVWLMQNAFFWIFNGLFIKI